MYDEWRMAHWLDKDTSTEDALDDLEAGYVEAMKEIYLLPVTSDDLEVLADELYREFIENYIELLLKLEGIESYEAAMIADETAIDLEITAFDKIRYGRK